MKLPKKQKPDISIAYNENNDRDETSYVEICIIFKGGINSIWNRSMYGINIRNQVYLTPSSNV